MSLFSLIDRLIKRLATGPQRGVVVPFERQTAWAVVRVWNDQDSDLLSQKDIIAITPDKPTADYLRDQEACADDSSFRSYRVIPVSFVPGPLSRHIKDPEVLGLYEQ